MHDVKEAAQALGLNVETVRLLMEEKVIDIGYVLKHKKRNRYIIVPELLQKEVERRNS